VLSLVASVVPTSDVRAFTKRLLLIIINNNRLVNAFLYPIIIRNRKAWTNTRARTQRERGGGEGLVVSEAYIFPAFYIYFCTYVYNGYMGEQVAGKKQMLQGC